MKMMFAAALCGGVIAAGLFAAPAGGPGEQTARRFGLFIGSNDGGRGRVMLRYAVSDARAVSRVFGEMGGIAGEDNILLLEPNLREISRQISDLAFRIEAAKQTHKRTELVFYYSGHSDEEGLLLGRERYRYAALRETINRLPSDMRIVILDSCSSGSFTRAKGGTKTQPFLIDSSLSAEGYAFLTSSSATEASQESDAIESSYFTHSLVAGLRGAADTVGDRRVTLNEVYHFAYVETLAKTETSVYGAQHPSYDMQISGTGDVVLTDIREISASLLIDEEIVGRLSIRDSSDYLIAEITKVSRKPMELGLEPGLYRITLQRGDNFYRAEVFLAGDSQTPVTQDDFRLISAAPGTARGETSGGTDDSWADEIRRAAEAHAPAEDGSGVSNSSAGDDRVNVLNLQLVPGRNLLNGAGGTDIFLLGLFTGSGHNLQGIGAAFIGLTNTGYAHGIQASGIFNTAGDVQGIQASGIFNTAGSVQGIQGAMIFSNAGDVQGIQGAMVFTNAGDVQGLQGSMVSNIARDIRGIQGAMASNIAGGNVVGIQGAMASNITRGNVLGIQGAMASNITGGDVVGLQGSLVSNIAGGNVWGIQAGLVNIVKGGTGEGAVADGVTRKPVTIQAGLVNVSRNENTVPFGLVNVVKNGILHPAVYYDSANFMNFGFRSGSKYFYSLFSFGTQRITTTDNLYVSRLGFGFEVPLGKAFVDLDVSSGTILNPDTLGEAFRISRPQENGGDDNHEQWKRYRQEREQIYRASSSVLAEVRLSGGYKFFEHLGVFAGVSYTYLYRRTGASPNPDAAWLGYRWDGGENIHRIGVFAGLQF
jgi:hypothetical protein